MHDVNKVLRCVEKGECENLKKVIEKWSIDIKKCDIYSSMFQYNNIDEVLDKGEENLKNPIFLLDTSYKVIGKSKKAYSINTSIEKCNNEEYLLEEIVRLMKEEKCINNIYESKGAFFHKEYIFCPIRSNDITVAYICLINENEFLKEDLEIVDTLAKVISIEIERQSIFINNSGLQEEYYLKDLLENKINDMDYIKEKLSEVNFEVKKNFMLISIPYEQRYQDFRHNFALKEFMRTIKNILRNAISTYYDNHIVIMLSADKEQLISEEIKNQFLEFLTLNKLRCGISISFQDLLEAKDFLKESKYAIEFTCNTNERISYFEDYIDEYLFYIANDFENKIEKIKLYNIIHPYIKKLLIFDKNNKTELLKTLEVYFRNNRHSNNTAKELNIHKSTFFYRFHKIEEIIKVSLESSEVLFKLELSLKILSSLAIEVTTKL